MRWLLLLFVASSLKASHAIHRRNFSNGDGLTGALTLSPKTTSNASEPLQLAGYGASLDSTVAEDNQTPVPAPSLWQNMFSLLVNFSKYPLEIMQKLTSSFSYIFKIPSDLVIEINSLSDKYLTKAIRVKISYIIVTLIAIVVRIVVITLGTNAKLAMQIFGEFCIYFPNLPSPIFELFIKGGKICPFQWVSVDQVEIRNSNDGERWELSLLFNFENVEIILASVETPTIFGSSGVGGLQLTANDVAVNLTLHFTKSVLPIILPIRSMADTTVHVNGCTAKQPDASRISDKIMEYASSLCDPILNGVMRIFFNLKQLFENNFG